MTDYKLLYASLLKELEALETDIYHGIDTQPPLDVALYAAAEIGNMITEGGKALDAS